MEGGGGLSAAEEEVARLQAANQAAAKENSKLRAEAADKQFELDQLDKQVRKLERKIEALEDVGAKRGTMAKGFLKPAAAADAARTAPPEPRPAPAERPRPKPWEKGGAGIIIDSSTGEQVDPKKFWPEDSEDPKETNVLLQAGDRSAERMLMREMQHPVEVNPEFDAKRYAELLGSQRREEAEEMIKREGGPTLEQMQRKPLEVLRSHPEIDPNWCDPQYNQCSLLQWACSMGFDAVALQLLQRKADPNHSTRNGMSCLAGACSKNSMRCAQHLLEFRANPNEVVEPAGGQTLLMWASRIEYCDSDGKEQPNPFVSMLLEARANVEATDHRSKTALLHACTEGNAPAVEALLAARADVDAADVEGSTALQISLRYYHGRISSLLVPLRRKAPAAGAAAAAAAGGGCGAGGGGGGGGEEVECPAGR